MAKYTCAQCRNDRLDETDRNCWRCGSKALLPVQEKTYEEAGFTFADDPELEKLMESLRKTRDDGTKF